MDKFEHRAVIKFLTKAGYKQMQAKPICNKFMGPLLQFLVQFEDGTMS